MLEFQLRKLSDYNKIYIILAKLTFKIQNI